MSVCRSRCRPSAIRRPLSSSEHANQIAADFVNGLLSEPEALVRFFRRIGVSVIRIGLEAGPLSQWLHAGLTEAGFDAVLLETRHVKAALSAMTVKTDRKDARGIAQLLRMGWFRPVHRNSPDAQEVRALLVGRKLLQSKLRDPSTPHGVIA